MIKATVAPQQIYQDIPEGVYVRELSKWAGTMGTGWEHLQGKCRKLL